MRLLEITLVCLIFLDVVLLLLGEHSRAVQLIFVVILCSFVLHVSLQGLHWQMGCSYLAIFLLGVSILLQGSPWVRWLSGIELALLACTVAMFYATPMFNLPKPGGPFRVATAVFQLTDSNRNEDEEFGGGKREVVVQAWYPSNCKGRKPAPYRRWKETTALSFYQRFVWTNSCEGGPVSTGGAPFPVLIFEPAMNGRRTSSTFLVEELASQGYVVFAIDHPYNSGPVELSNGKVLQIPPSPLEHLGTLGLDGFYAVVDKEVKKQTADTVFVLDSIETWNEDPTNIFHRRLDLDRIGALGHSLGGSVAAETSLVDPRIRAVFGMSSPLLGAARQDGVKVPFFEIIEKISLLSEAQLAQLSPDERVDAAGDIADMKNLAWNFAEHGGYLAVLNGADHSSFSDRAILADVGLRWGKAATEEHRFSIIRRYAVEFFSEALRSRSAPLLRQEPSPFPEVAFHHYGAPR